MAISKSTPYVRYKKDFTSSLHLGTIHIESEYLDRTQKTTIESIHGMTWHNKVVNENKELNLLSDTQLELTELEKQYWNTGEKRVSVDEIHSLEEVEPNEDGTYTYTVNSMEGEYIEIYDGINNITSTSDGLDGQFEIVYDTTEEDVSGNIALDQVAQQYEITDSGAGAITGAKSTGLTLVNHITEPSKEEAVAIQEYEGQYFTIENTVQGNIKSAILKGQTLVNLANYELSTSTNEISCRQDFSLQKNNTTYTLFNFTDKPITFNTYITSSWRGFENVEANSKRLLTLNDFTINEVIGRSANGWDKTTETEKFLNGYMIIEGDHTQEDIPYFEGMQSVKMPVLTTFSYTNLINENDKTFLTPYLYPNKLFYKSTNNTHHTLHYYNADKVKIGNSGNEWSSKSQYQPPYGTVFVKMEYTADTLSPMLGYNNEETYKPFTPIKSNILTVNEEVELRGVGDVQDELNLLTGELTQRLDTLVLDGSENWYQNNVVNGYFIATLNIPNLSHNFKGLQNTLCDKFPIAYQAWTANSEGISMLDSHIYIAINKDVVSTVDGLKTWLSNNVLNLVYEKSQESVKTVDLTVQNQDGGTIPRIQTQQGITHVSTSSDGLTPVVEMSCSYDTIIKPNTTYTIKLDRPIVSDTMYLQVDLGGTMMMLDADVNAFTIKTPSTLSHNQLRLSGTGNTVKEIIVLEGNRVNDKIEYFEGMKNVENPILIVSNCQYVFGKGGRL